MNLFNKFILNVNKFYSNWITSYLNRVPTLTRPSGELKSRAKLLLLLTRRKVCSPHRNRDFEAIEGVYGANSTGRLPVVALLLSVRNLFHLLSVRLRCELVVPLDLSDYHIVVVIVGLIKYLYSAVFIRGALDPCLQCPDWRRGRFSGACGTDQRRSFSVAGPTSWNSLPVALLLTPVAHSALFLSGLKTTLFDRGWAGSAPE